MLSPSLYFGEIGYARRLELLTNFLPDGWEGMAVQPSAPRVLRKDKSAENPPRVFLLHLGLSYSLSESDVRTCQSGLAERTDTVLSGRTAKSTSCAYAAFSGRPSVKNA